MKVISAAMAAHLKQATTTLTTLWKIKRVDGKVFGFTELDRDITYDGLLYKSTGGFNKSAMKSSATLSVDNLEVSGFLSDDTIPDTELRNGAFDYAEVEIFMINYMDHSMGTIKLRYGYFGEVKSAPSGAFLVELRGLIQLLGQKIGEIYTPECRADLGDSRCKVLTLPEERRSGKNYRPGDRVLAAVMPTTKKLPTALPLANAGFDTLSPKGWRTNFYTGFSEGDAWVKPHSGSYFMRLTYGKDRGSIGQGAALVTGSITANDIATGRLKARFGGWFCGLVEGQVPLVEIVFYTGTNLNGTRIKTIEQRLEIPAPTRVWQYRTFDVDIPSNARSMSVWSWIAEVPQFSRYDLGLDDFSVEIIMPDEPPTDFSLFGGVEFEATVTGAAGTTMPVFNPTIGALTTDGGQVWKAVTPNHVFLDTVAVDATNSSTLVLTNVDKPDDWFAWGVLRILTGENAGMAVEPISWNNTTKTLKLAMPLPAQTVAGTLVQISTGCDRSRKTCKAKFNNLLNFRGEPDIPGVGQYFKVAGL